MSPAQVDVSSETDAPVVPVQAPLAPGENAVARRATAAVLHVINGEHYAGAERVQDLLAERLPAQGFTVGFACLKPDRFPEARRSRSTPLYRLPMGSRFDLRVVRQLTQIIRAEGYQLVHAHTPRSALIARLAARAARVPMVYHVHSPSWHDSTRRWQDRANALLERFTLRGPVALIAVSESLARQMADRGFDRHRIAVVHNGVPRVEPAPDRTPPTDRWRLGAVALWRPRKGIEVLLDALAALVAERLPVSLRVVGPFETRAYQLELQQRAARLGLDSHVEWVGFRSDVLAELATMDLFVLPSLFGEGLPMVMLEAMSAGVPVVASRVDGIAEAIADRDDGLLAIPGDAGDLARAIRQVVAGQLDWSQLRTRALARQARDFSAESMSAGVAAVYHALLG
jgi:glycosyltransferase involved in cell wall biosynthesis